MLHLSKKSKEAFVAALKAFSDTDIAQAHGTCVLWEPLHLIVRSSKNKRFYHTQIPAGSELHFWRDNDDSITGRSTKKPSYKSRRCTLFASDGSCQLSYNPGARQPFDFQWLDQRLMPAYKEL